MLKLYRIKGCVHLLRSTRAVWVLLRTEKNLTPYRYSNPGPTNPQRRHCIARAERDGTRAETRFRLSPKRTSPFKSVGASVQSTAGGQGVRISFSNAGYTTLGGGVTVLATHSICQFPLHFPSRASQCATRFRTSCTAKRSITPVGSISTVCICHVSSRTSKTSNSRNLRLTS